jgi:hypothetical protein
MIPSPYVAVHSYQICRNLMKRLHAEQVGQAFRIPDRTARERRFEELNQERESMAWCDGVVRALDMIGRSHGGRW